MRYRGVRCLLIALWCSSALAEPDADAGFRTQIEALAKARHREVLSWGTLLLDGAKPHRFAALGVELGADNERVRPADDTGAYILETAPATFTLISYAWDGTSFHVSDGEGPDGRTTGHPPWLELAETTILHGQNHNHGKSYVWFGLRGAKLVVLADEDSSSRRDPETTHHDYTCPKDCSSLGANRIAKDELLRVVGSARTIAALPKF